MARPGGWRIALWVGILLILLEFLWLVRGVLLPFLLAFAISALLAPLIAKLQRRGWPKGLAIASIFGLFFGSLVALGIWLTPVVSNQVVGFKERIEDVSTGFAQPNEDTNFFVRWNPVVIDRATSSKDAVDTFLMTNSATLERLGLPSNKRAIYAQYVEPQRGQINKSLQNFLQGFVGIASTFVSQVLVLLFVPLLVLLILPNWESLRRKVFALIPPQIRPTTVALLEDIGAVFSSYLRGVSIAVSGYMAFMAILLTVLGAPYGVILGVLFGMVYLIPYLNVILASSVLFGVTMLSGQKAGPIFGFASPFTFALTIVAVFAVCHLVYDNIVYPQLVGRGVGLDPIVSMFVIFSGGALFGLPGMILAFPFAGSVKVVLERLLGVTNRQETTLVLPSIPERHRASAHLSP